MKLEAHRMADNIIGFAAESGSFGVGAWWILVFVLIWFPSMGEIQIMCDMYMDEAGIPMLVTMLK